MKKLVKKIALPGAILAFAMALFGGSAYAEEKLKSWEEQGRKHADETLGYIGELTEKIKILKDERDEFEREKNRLEKENREGSERKQSLIDEKQSLIDKKQEELNAALRERDTHKTNTETVEIHHNTQMDLAIKDMEILRNTAKQAVRDHVRPVE